MYNNIYCLLLYTFESEKIVLEHTFFYDTVD